MVPITSNGSYKTTEKRKACVVRRCTHDDLWWGAKWKWWVTSDNVSFWWNRQTADVSMWHTSCCAVISVWRPRQFAVVSGCDHVVFLITNTNKKTKKVNIIRKLSLLFRFFVALNCCCCCCHKAVFCLSIGEIEFGKYENYYHFVFVQYVNAFDWEETTQKSRWTEREMFSETKMKCAKLTE